MAELTGFGSGASNAAAAATPAPIDYSKVTVKILEQPASHKLRFRQDCLALLSYYKHFCTSQVKVASNITFIILTLNCTKIQALKLPFINAELKFF